MGFGGAQNRPEVGDNQELFNTATGESMGRRFVKDGKLGGFVGRILYKKGRIGVRDIAPTESSAAAAQTVMNPTAAPAPQVPPVVEAPPNPAQEIAQTIINDQLMAQNIGKRRERFNRWGTRPW